jgi:internalin A
MKFEYLVTNILRFISLLETASDSEWEELEIYDEQLSEDVGVPIGRHSIKLDFPHPLSTITDAKESEIAQKVGALNRLKRLRIRIGYLGKLIPEMCNLTNLVELDISKNNIYNLPAEIGNLINLETLNLSSSQLTALPQEIGELSNLEILDLRHNNLTELPVEIFDLSKLKRLDLRDNNFRIPPEVVEKIDQPQMVLAYYANISASEIIKNLDVGQLTLEFFEGIKNIDIKRIIRKLRFGKPINEIKLLIVGQGSVGKTSLVQQILHGTFDQNQNKTEGISINQWRVERREKPEPEGQSDSEIGNPKSEVKLNIWDFGGQEIMHATHQFFLTKRSLYLLVLDSRLTQEENRVEYWLKIIQSFGGESPVLIVGNKTDQHPLDIDRTGLQKKYPNIVGILETSAATGKGIKALKAGIAKHVDTLPHVRDLLPETWFTVKSKLEELGKGNNFITRDEYLSLCAENDVTDETSQHTLIGFLHDLGVVLHFQDDPRLEALGILNPQWVTNGVYKILNSHELFQNQGTLTLPILNKTLNSPHYPSNKRLFIVDMMKKFELCYDIEPDKSFLIPDLLPKDEPYTGEWDGALEFHYHYYVLPTSIISRFIVRMNAFIYKTIWRSGVVLKSGGNTALVKADTEDKSMYIRVSGNVNTRRDFLSMIRGELEAIHRTIPNIEATEKVPIPNHPKADPVDYTFLLQLERDGRKSFPVSINGKIVDISVSELLNGIRPSKNRAIRVFISYSHQDKSFAKKLAAKLENQGMKVWWDFDSLKGGQDWQKEIERGIKQCDFFLVALTPNAVASEWVGNEITYASQAQKTIIPLLLMKCDIPIGLIKKQWIHFENQTQKAAIKELLVMLKQ